MRMIRLGDISFAAVSTEMSAERDVKLANKFRGMRCEASARLLPTSYGIQISTSCRVGNLKRVSTATSELEKKLKNVPKLGNVVTRNWAPSTCVSTNSCPNWINGTMDDAASSLLSVGVI
jgi:hypothetical protein